MNYLDLFLHQNIKSLLTAISSEITELTHADFCSIYLANDRYDLYRAHTTVPLKKRITSRKTGKTYRSFNEAIPLRITPEELQKAHIKISDAQLAYILLLPLFYKKRRLGVISLTSKSAFADGIEHTSTVKEFTQLATVALERIQEKLRLRDDLEQRDLFISMASHEMKTPLTTISSYIQYLQEMHKEGEAFDSTDFIQMYDQVERLRDTIDNFLNINIIKSGEVVYGSDEISVFDTLKAVATTFALHYPDHELVMPQEQEQDTLWVKGDYHKLTQAFINIVLNAGKYSPKDSPVVLDYQEDDESVIVTITDQGVGIPKKDRYKVFELFYRSNATEKKIDGKGIGLFLAKKIIEGHRGTISLDSQEGKGSTFTITLPKLSGE